jgi:8-oxo-dGTP pyrophosphatase MutT (NUDIX family)
MSVSRRDWPAVQAEIASLADRYGAPLSRTIEFPAVSTSTGPAGFPLSSPRTAEVVLIVPRRLNKILTHTKHFYPSGIWRLPTGGIQRGEGIEHALLRESVEETGNELRPVSFLFRIEYRWEGSGKRFDSFGFLMSEAAEPIASRDPREQITAFRDVGRDGLRRIGERLESLGGSWRQWGLFRTVPHRTLLHLWPPSGTLNDISKDRGNRDRPSVDSNRPTPPALPETDHPKGSDRN